MPFDHPSGKLRELGADSSTDQEIPSENNHKNADERIALYTQKLVRATYVLGIATIIVAGIATWQAIITRNAIGDQSIANDKQIRAILSQDSGIKRQADAAETQLIISRDADSIQDIRFKSQIAISQSAAKDQRDEARTQLDSFHTQLSISREVMERQLRAYICATYDTNIEYTMDVILKNSGQTPASNVVSHTVTEVVSLANPIFDTAFIPKSSSSKIINPGENFYIHTSLHSLNQDMINAIKNGSSAVFVWGQVRYKDVFGIQRVTKYRWRYGISGFPYFLTTCEEGNEAN
jgi:hypothetical protein